MAKKTAIYLPNNSLYNYFKNRKDIIFLYPEHYQIIKNGIRKSINYYQFNHSIDFNNLSYLKLLLQFQNLRTLLMTVSFEKKII